MKIAILGAGAMGSLYASFLVKNHDITLIDSYKPQVDQINTYGIIKTSKDQSETPIKVKAVYSSTDIGIQDLIIVFVKGMNTYTTMEENQKLIGPATIVLTLQNGAGNNSDIANFVNKEKVIVGTSSHNSVSMGLGKFYHSGHGPTNIGPDYPCKQSLLDVEKIAEAFSICDIDVHVIEDIQKVLWQKLFVNCGINGLSALMLCNVGTVHENPNLWKLCQKIVYECVLVAEADGTYFDRKDALCVVEKVCINDATGFASMCQDRKNKKLTEIDRINGVVVNLGKQYGIPTPCNSMLTTQIHATEYMYDL